MDAHPKKIIVVGFFLVLFGFVAPFLMVMKVIESTFFLSFLSHAASTSGMFLGIIGAAMLFAREKRQ